MSRWNKENKSIYLTLQKILTKTGETNYSTSERRGFSRRTSSIRVDPEANQLNPFACLKRRLKMTSRLSAVFGGQKREIDTWCHIIHIIPDNVELLDKMNFPEAKSEIKRLLGRVDPSELPRLINWIQGSGEPPATTGPKRSSPVALVKMAALPATSAVMH